MLYKLKGSQGAWDDLETMPFKNMADIGRLEKDLENLLAAHLLDTLFWASAKGSKS